MPINSWIITLHVDVPYSTVYVFICELYECEIKLNSLGKFSVDSHFRIYLNLLNGLRDGACSQTWPS